MKKETAKECLKAGFAYFVFAAALFALQLAMYIRSGLATGTMDACAWLFFVTSCVSHGTILALIPYLLLFMPPALSGHRKTGYVLMIAGVSLVSILLFLNMQVFALYRFHINRFVINLVFGNHAEEVFTFDTLIYVKEFLLFAVLIAVCAGMSVPAARLGKRCSGRVAAGVVGIMAACTLTANGIHAYGDFVLKFSVLNTRGMLPYYYPLTARGFFAGLGFRPPNEELPSEGLEMAQRSVLYPVHPLDVKARADKPNIVLILIDSWSKRSLSAECMPNTYRYAGESLWYDNHISSCNRTQGGVFGIFFSVPSYYWDIFYQQGKSPLFINQMLEQGYKCQVYPGASLSTYPPFDKVVFHRIPGLNTETEGNTVYERDCRLTENFIGDMRRNARQGGPFFSMLFYDLPHSFELTEDKLTRFTPSAKYMDYTSLSNSTDPLPIFNLYRNTCYQTDSLIGRAIDAIGEEGIADNTIVIITGDHGQEINECGKNFWGHASNFSKWQTHTPLILHLPGKEREARRLTHRTTHYDIVPTLMTEALGVTNPVEDYSMGHLLSDTCSRKWHTMAKDRSLVFITDNDTIVEKTGDGILLVTDAELNLAPEYRFNAKELNAAIKNLDRFLK